MNKVNVNIITTDEFEGLEIPQYETAGAAGFDIRAANKGNIIIQPGCTELISSGLIFEVPQGYELQIRSRSGMAVKQGMVVKNQPGTLDSDYRGQLMVALWNTTQKPFTVERGMRIAQGVVSPVVQAHFILANEVTETERGSGGFGSTGTK